MQKTARLTVTYARGHAASVKITCRNNMAPYVELTLVKHSRKKSRGTLCEYRESLAQSIFPRLWYISRNPRDYMFGDRGQIHRQTPKLKSLPHVTIIQY